jgi:hypothetical protein
VILDYRDLKSFLALIISFIARSMHELGHNFGKPINLGKDMTGLGNLLDKQNASLQYRSKRGNEKESVLNTLYRVLSR